MSKYSPERHTKSNSYPNPYIHIHLLNTSNISADIFYRDFKTRKLYLVQKKKSFSNICFVCFEKIWEIWICTRFIT